MDAGWEKRGICLSIGVHSIRVWVRLAVATVALILCVLVLVLIKFYVRVADTLKSVWGPTNR